jgi:hypothetical protein
MMHVLLETWPSPRETGRSCSGVMTASRASGEMCADSRGSGMSTHSSRHHGCGARWPTGYMLLPRVGGVSRCGALGPVVGPGCTVNMSATTVISATATPPPPPTPTGSPVSPPPLLRFCLRNRTHRSRVAAHGRPPSRPGTSHSTSRACSRGQSQVPRPRSASASVAESPRIGVADLACPLPTHPPPPNRRLLPPRRPALAATRAHAPRLTRPPPTPMHCSGSRIPHTAPPLPMPMHHG